MANWLGIVGHFASLSLSYLFGVSSFLMTAFAGWIGWQLVTGHELPRLKMTLLYFALFTISLSLLLNFCAEQGMPVPGALKHKIISEAFDFALPYPHHLTRHNLGGVPLYYLYRDLPHLNLKSLLSDVGVVITFTTVGLASLALALDVDLALAVQQLGQKKNRSSRSRLSEEEIEKSLTITPPTELPPRPEIRIRTHTVREPPPLPMARSRGDFTSYELPPVSLLNNPKKIDQPLLKKELHRQAEILEETLMSFGIEAKVGEINCGPTITSFEIHPAVGVKVQKITALESDIALKLQAKSIRIIAPIPGKAAVGVEIPSPFPQEVGFKEMLLLYQQMPRKLQIPILLGKTVSGDNVMSDLAKMPHCLIAGATGSGKSVCINSLIMSILMNARPDEIKLLMIDPKKVELTAYSTLPHMIAPIITEPHGAYAALQWLVREMQVRYEILKELGVRNITAFNQRKIDREFEASLGMPVPEKMSMIVAIIDEFADLMMASSSDLETPVARIAQMARAVGIHLILATQRPSREVITGLIKANFPTRIAFKVASRINSQIILDENGAESLLGNGDMLFLPPGSSHLVRAQGIYVGDDEISRVIKFISDQAPPNYLIASFDKAAPGLSGENDEEGGRDQLYLQAREIVVETKTASTTFLQRKLKIGYARAASLMDELELRGVIGPQEGSKPRRVLIEGVHGGDRGD
jgi:S-DNA-T family DNA segregation ATPase FtsK/SpoIIIE